MVKAEFKVICRVYGVKPRALKECLKKENIKVKNASKREVLNTIFVYAPDLMFSRSIGDGAVEYYEKDMPKRLAKAMTDANNEEHSNEK